MQGSESPERSDLPRKTGREKSIEAGLTPYLAIAMSFLVVCLVMSAACGTDVLRYLSFPAAFLISFFLIFVCASSELSCQQIRLRLGRSRFTDALEFYRAGGASSLIAAVVMTFLYTACAPVISESLLGMREMYLVMFAAAPCFFLVCRAGNRIGFLESLGLGSAARLSLWIVSAAMILFSILFGMLGNRYGERVSALLRNEGYRAVYAAGGIFLGLAVALLIMLCYLAFLARSARKAVEERQDYLQIDNEERLSDLILYYFRKLLPALVPSLVPAVCLTFDYHMVRKEAGESFADAYSCVSGICLPILMTATLLMLILVRSLLFRSVSILRDERIQKGSASFNVLLRLSGYLMIPASFYVFSAARPLVRLFYGHLTDTGKESAVLGLKTGSMIILFGGLAFCLSVLCWQCYAAHYLTIAAAVAAAGQIIFMVLVAVNFVSAANAIMASLLVMSIFWTVSLAILAIRGILRRPDPGILIDYALTAVSAAIAQIPVLLLSRVVTDEIIPVGGAILLLFIYVPLFVVLSLYLRAADLANIHRIPGGNAVLMIARLLRLSR